MNLRSILVLIGLLAAGSMASAQYADVNSFLQLGGSSYISIPYNDQLNLNFANTGQISIDAWVYPTSGGTKMAIVGNDEATGYWFGMTSARKLRFSPNPGMWQESSSSIPLNTWTHVGVSYDAFKNSMVFYINGSIDRTISTPQSYIAYNYSDLRIGADRLKTGPAMYWNGGLDEVRIWNAAMNYSNAAGLLYRIPLAMTGGLHGRYMMGGWRMNGNAQSVDGKVNGTAIGGVSYATKPDAPFYSRIAFVATNGPDRSDHLTIPHRAALTLTQPFTLECWVRPTSGGNTQYQTFITKGLYSSSRYNYWFGLNKSNMRLMFLPNGDWKNPTTSNAALPLNAWSHVAARFEQNGSNFIATVFIDGVPAGSRSYTSTGSGNTDPVIIAAAGTRSSGYTAYGYSGHIDEVRIWKVARTDDQIADYHRVEMQGGQSGMLARYPMHGDDVDRSGNNFDGTADFRGSTAYFADASSQPSPPNIVLIRPLGGERWEIGSTQSIRWTAIGLVNVRIELSRDGGQTFTPLAASVPASPGAYQWTVDGPPTTTAIVRVRNISSNEFSAQSQSFQIEDPVPVLDVAPRQLVFNMYEGGPAPAPQYIHLRNVGGKTLSWTANRLSKMWYTLDPEQGSSNEDSVKVEITDTQLALGTHTDNVRIGGNAVNAGILVNIVCNVVPAESYQISGTVRTGSGAPAAGVRMVVVGTMSAEAWTDASGDYAVSGLIPGDYSIAPTSTFFDFTPASESFNGLSEDKSGVDFRATRRSGDIVIRFKEGWNLLSIPIPQDDNGVGEVFPNAVGTAYEYIPDQGYAEATELEPGKGYWIKFNSPDSIVISGPYQTALELTLQDEYGGWNLIGGPCGTVPLMNIAENPAGALLQVFAYDPDTGYMDPPGAALHAGQAYFMRVNVEAVVQLITQSFAPVGNPFLEDAWYHAHDRKRASPPPPPFMKPPPEN